MNVFKRAGALALALALTMTAACLTGCGGSASSSAPSVPESIELTEVDDLFETLSGVPTNAVVATAGGTEITAADLLYWVAYGADSMYQYYAMYGLTDLPWDTTSEDGVTLADTLKKDALNSAALYALIPSIAEQEGVELPEDFYPMIESTITEMTQSLGSEENMNYYLWQYPMNTSLYTSMCESEEYNALIMESRFAEGTEGYPTDAEVMDYVNNELELYSVKHILRFTIDPDTGEALSEEEIANQKALCDDIIAQLEASSDVPTLFDSLMHEYSEDTGLAAYPDGYLATQKGQMVTEFEEASLALEVGEFSGIVESSYGYHIILRLPLEVSAADYRNDCITQRMTQLQDSWLAANEIVTNENYDKIDPATYYDTLNLLRDAVSVKMAEITAEQEAAQSGSASTSADQSAASSASSNTQ